MRTLKSPQIFFLLLVTIGFFTSCLTSKKIDRFVSQQYGNEIPKQKKLKPELTIKSSVVTKGSEISVTNKRKLKVLPLLVYWKFDQNQKTQLNPVIGVNNFSNSVNQLISKELGSKLQGNQLELQVEKIPSSFALVAEDHLVFALLYYVQWSKIYIKPDFNDLVVSYRLTDNNNSIKTGTITVKNNNKNKDFRFFQGWKSALRETVEEYNENMTNLSKQFVNELVIEL